MSVTMNNFNEIIKSLKFYALGCTDEGASAKAVLTIADDFLENQNNALDIIKKVIAEKDEWKKMFNAKKEISHTDDSEKRVEIAEMKREIRRLKDLLVKKKISYRKPAQKKKK